MFFTIDHNTSALIVRLIARVGLIRQTHVCPVISLVILLPGPLRHDPRFIQCMYRYSHASKRLVEVYLSRTMLVIMIGEFSNLEVPVSSIVLGRL